MTIIWPGVPGESFVNTTDKILYQFICSWHNTCGACAQYHLAVAKWWSKIHRGCNCESRPIYPDAKSEEYQDWHEIVEGLPDDQKKKVVGDGVMKLIEAKVIDWGDVITSNRVKLLREIVSIKQLDISDLTGAGISQRIADDAWSTVNTQAHVIAERQRTQLLKQIRDLGIQPQHLKEIFGEIMAQRIGIGGGPSGTSVIPPGKTDEQWIEILMRSFKTGGGGPAPLPKPQPQPAPEPIPTPQPPPQSIEDFAQRAMDAAKAVPVDLRYGDDKVWITDAYSNYLKSYPGTTLDEFKDLLIEANIARLLTFAVMDLPHRLSKADRQKTEDSATVQGRLEYHFLRLMQQQR